MTPSFAARHKTRRYRYYVCCGAQKRGWRTCPSKSIPAVEIEQFVLGRIQDIGKNPELLHEALGQERADTAQNPTLSVEEVAQAWSDLYRRWAGLTPEETARLVGLVVERVDYDGAKGKVAITFQPSGIRRMAEELIFPTKETSQ